MRVEAKAKGLTDSINHRKWPRADMRHEWCRAIVSVE